MQEKVDKLLDDMKILESDTDYEKAHYEADRILVELIDTYAETYGHKDEVGEILNIYDNLKKWYS